MIQRLLRVLLHDGLLFAAITLLLTIFVVLGCQLQSRLPSAVGCLPWTYNRFDLNFAVDRVANVDDALQALNGHRFLLD